MLSSFFFAADAAYAAEPFPGVQVHGFLTQGFVLTSDNHFYGDSDEGGSLDFTEIGVNASWSPKPSLRFAGQLLFRRAGEEDDGLDLDFGLLDYTIHSEAENRVGVRVGRLKAPIGLYNDTRDVAFTRPGIWLPQSIYFDRSRKATLSADGLIAYAEHRSAAGDFFLELGAGWPQANNIQTERALLLRDHPGEVQGQPSYVARLVSEHLGGAVRLALTGVHAQQEYRPAAVDPLERGTIRFRPWILSAQYNAEDWSLTAEYARRRLRYRDLGALVPDTDLEGESYYLQGTYQISPKWEAMLRYDVLYADREDRDGKEYAASTRTGAPAHGRFAKDWTVGLRWDVTPSFMLRAEYHRVDGTAWLPGLDNPNPSATERKWDLFGLLGSFRF